MTNSKSLTDKALDAFWQVVLEQFPQASSGDLSPSTTIALDMAAKTAIDEWIANNITTQQCTVVPGYRFRLFRQVDRLPDFLATPGMTGVVTIVDDSGVWCRMDQQISGAEHWENQIHWQSPDEFARDTVSVRSPAAGVGSH